MSRRNSASVVCEFDSLCPGVCLKSLTRGKKKGTQQKGKRPGITLRERGKIPNQLPGGQQISFAGGKKKMLIF